MTSRRQVLMSSLGTGLQSLLLPVQAPLTSPNLPGLQAWGYFPVWLSDAWRQLNLTPWDRVLLFEISVNAAGSLAVPSSWDTTWHRLADAVRNSGGHLDVAVTLFDENRFIQLLSTPASSERLLRSLMMLANLPGIQGLHLDFEIYRVLPDTALRGYRQLIVELKQGLAERRLDRKLSVFLPMGGEGTLYDGQTLTHIDYVVVQGYDAHFGMSPQAGPVAPLKGSHSLTWERSLAHVLRMDVPRSKLLFSIPYFGYEWPVVSAFPGAATIGPGIAMTYAPVDARHLPLIRVSVLDRMRQYPVQRDPDSGSPYYAYQGANGIWYQGWFEDKTSLADKLDFLVRERLCGVAAFPLGYDAGRFDSLITSRARRRP
jgi:spore germination protein YaaH